MIIRERVVKRRGYVKMQVTSVSVCLLIAPRVEYLNDLLK